MERESRADEARHRAIFEHALDAMFLTAPTGVILAANEAACRMLGRTEDEICTVGRAGVMDESDPRFRAAIEERRRTGLLRTELTALRKDGSRFPVEVSSAVYVDAEGCERTSIVMRDLTEQKRAEDRLKLIADAGAVLGRTLEYEATIADLTRLIVPRLGDFCMVDLVEHGALRRVAASHVDPKRAAALLALSPGAIVNREAGVYAVARTGIPELAPEIDDDWLRSTTRDDAHLEIVRRFAPRSAVIVPLRGRAGVIGVLTIASLDPHRRYDVSDLAAARAVADRAALAIDNARLHAQVVEEKKLRDEVLAIVSHDLRNPLNAIQLHARVLARREPSEGLRSIIHAVQRADALIADLLTVAALEGGSVPLERERCSAASLVRDSVDLHRPIAADRKITLEELPVEAGDDLYVDRHRMLQVLGNLIGNALKFTPDGGRVSVGANRAGEHVVFRVADTGRGIPPESLPHVFDRFWQGAHAHRAGAGLGLAIAKGIVEEHGGTITVESAPGRGATFTFTVPVSPH